MFVWLLLVTRSEALKNGTAISKENWTSQKNFSMEEKRKHLVIWAKKLWISDVSLSFYQDSHPPTRLAQILQ